MNYSVRLIINGGITSVQQIKNHLTKVDGVMIGRSVYHSPYFLAEIEKEVFKNNNILSRQDIIKSLIPTAYTLFSVHCKEIYNISV